MSDAGAGRRGILAGGNWVVDHVKLIDAWPRQDSLASIAAESKSSGGAPYNVLKDLARLGAPFPLEAVGLVGDDPDGRAILADCRAHGIDTAQLRTTPKAPTSYTDVMTVRSDGRRTFFHQRGANAHLGVAHFAFERTRARIFHLGYLLLLDQLDSAGSDGLPLSRKVLEAASAAGLRTSVDLVSEDSGRFGPVVTPVLPSIDILFVNDFEAERLAEIELRKQGRISPGAVREAAQVLLGRGVRQWVVLHFPEATYAAGADGRSLWQPSLLLPASQIQGTVGAGDALAAGLLYGLHENWPMADSLRLGACVAAAALRHPSSSEGVLPLRECQELAATFGFRPLPA